MNIKEPILYRRWQGMRSRCYNPRSPAFKYYGGRGIAICPEWLADYSAFEKWALSHGFSPELSIDRIDVNGNYAPDNCRWADTLTQARNKTTNLVLGGVSMTEGQWAEALGVSRGTLAMRRREGWPDVRVLHPEYYPTAQPPAGATLLRCPLCGGDYVALYFDAQKRRPSNIYGSGRCRRRACKHIWPLDAESYRLFATRPGIVGPNATNLSLCGVRI